MNSAQGAPVHRSTAWYTVTTVAESMAVGAGLGALTFGPIGMAVGTGAGFVTAVVGRVLESKARMARVFIENVDASVRHHFASTGLSTVGLPHAVQASMVGARSGCQEGWRQGWQMGVEIIRVLF